MRVIDADGHVEENPATFSDKYLEPAFRSRRPRVIGMDGLAYWLIDEQLFPRRVGRGCHNLGTPVSYDGKPTRHAHNSALRFGSGRPPVHAGTRTLGGSLWRVIHRAGDPGGWSPPLCAAGVIHREQTPARVDDFLESLLTDGHS